MHTEVAEPLPQAIHVDVVPVVRFSVWSN